MAEQPDKSKMIENLAVSGGVIVGFVALVVAIAAYTTANLLAVGVCLIAAALAFGLIANAVLRH